MQELKLCKSPFRGMLQVGHLASLGTGCCCKHSVPHLAVWPFSIVGNDQPPSLDLYEGPPCLSASFSPHLCPQRVTLTMIVAHGYWLSADGPKEKPLPGSIRLSPNNGLHKPGSQRSPRYTLFQSI